MFTRVALMSAFSLLAACGGAPTELPPTPDQGSVAPYKAGMTWYKDVQPLVQRHCQSCHVASGIAPFSLTSVTEVQGMAGPVASAVTARRMPPWMPASGCQDLVGDRSLTDDEIGTFSSWVKDQAPAGDPADAPPPQPPVEMKLAWSDVRMDPGSSYSPPARSTTDYHCFLMDPRLTQDRDLIGFAVTPGDRRMVHHVLLFPADAVEAKALDDRDAGPGWSCFGGPGLQTASMVGGWVPGSPPTTYPAGTGLSLKAGQILVMQVHYDNHSGGAWGADRTVAELQFARQPVKAARVVNLRNATFAIPPGATGYQTQGSLTLPTDAVVQGMAPHAHTLGRRLRVDTADTCLVDIPRWDFSWQQMYFLKSPAGIKRVLPASMRELTCARG